MMIFPKLVTGPSVKPIDLAMVKRHLNIVFPDHDTLLDQMIDAAISNMDAANGLLGRCLINQTWKTYHGRWRTRMGSPFTDVSAVTVKYYDDDEVLQTLDAANYIVYSDYIMFRSTFTAPVLDDDRDDPIQIDWTCGFGDKAIYVPPDLSRAMLTLIAHWYETREAVVPNERRVQMEEMPLAFRDVIDRYKTGFVV